jgi:hypothetical protein
MGRWGVTPLLFRPQYFDLGKEVMGNVMSRHNCPEICAGCQIEGLTGW